MQSLSGKIQSPLCHAAPQQWGGCHSTAGAVMLCAGMDARSFYAELMETPRGARVTAGYHYSLSIVQVTGVQQVIM